MAGNTPRRSNSCPQSGHSKYGENNNDTSALTVGDPVEHDRFGIDTVVSLEGAGSSAKAGVDFRTAGHKTLLLKFAKIRKL